MKKTIQTFEPNDEGRDFVIGDLHGAYSCFERLLEGLNFDKSKDRMFSVGDLIDRGPESFRCLSLLQEPWFHSVIANHEQMMLEAFEGGPTGQYWLQNGGMWGVGPLSNYIQLQPQLEDWGCELLDLIGLVKELPFLITVKLPSGEQVHIIHAELPPPIDEITDDDLADEIIVRDLARVQSSDGDFLVWGRYLFYSFFREDLSNSNKNRRKVSYLLKDKSHSPKLSKIVSGHTVVQHPLTIGKQTNIDTSAHCSISDPRNWTALTCLELKTWKFYQATPTDFRTTEPVVINTDSAEESK